MALVFGMIVENFWCFNKWEPEQSLEVVIYLQATTWEEAKSYWQQITHWTLSSQAYCLTEAVTCKA